MLLGHVLPGIRPYRFASTLTNQKKSKCERLREGGRKQFVKIPSVIPAGFGMCVEDIAEFLSHLQKSVSRAVCTVEFC